MHPDHKVGLVIGKGGSHAVYFQHQSGAAIHVAREEGEIPGGGTAFDLTGRDDAPAVTADGMRRVALVGDERQTAAAADLIRQLLDASDDRCDRSTEIARARAAAAETNGARKGFGLGAVSEFDAVDPGVVTRPALRHSSASSAYSSASRLRGALSFVGSETAPDLSPGFDLAMAARCQPYVAPHLPPPREGDVAATISVPHRRVGLIIGRGGENVRFLQQQTRAHVQVQPERDVHPAQTERLVYLRGEETRARKPRG